MRDQRIKTRNYHAINAHMRSSAGSMKEKSKEKDKYICRNNKQTIEEAIEDYDLLESRYSLYDIVDYEIDYEYEDDLE
jgi:hypothetical protein